MFNAINSLYGFGVAGPSGITGTDWVDQGATGLSASSNVTGGYGLGKLWNLAPSTTSGGSRRVESSSDGGVTWDLVSSSFPVGSRDASSGQMISGSFPFLAYGGKLWLMFGDANSNFGWAENRVYSSPDGISWTNLGIPAGIVGRYVHAGCVHNGKMVISGGTNYYYGDSHDVWETTDGVTFTQKTAAAGWAARSGHAMLSFLGALWVIGGNTYNDVWKSVDDGTNWTQVTAGAAFSGRNRHGACVADGKMWICGGTSSGAVVNDDVWWSLDGETWTLATDAPGFAVRQSIALATVDDTYLVGYGGGGATNTDCWRSA